jgi:hypothetical protein
MKLLTLMAILFTLTACQKSYYGLEVINSDDCHRNGHLTQENVKTKDGKFICGGEIPEGLIINGRYKSKDN